MWVNVAFLVQSDRPVPSSLIMCSFYYCICICIQLYICVSRSCHPLLSSLVMCPLPEQAGHPVWSPRLPLYLSPVLQIHIKCKCICIQVKWPSHQPCICVINIFHPLYVYICVTTMMYTWPCQKVWMYTWLYTHSSSIIITELCSLSKEHCTQSAL